jgi:hypothetical protein
VAGYDRTERAMAHVGATGGVMVANPSPSLQIAAGLVPRTRAVEVLHAVEVLDPAHLAAARPQR